MKPALLIIDMQPVYLQREGFSKNAEDLSHNINELVDTAHEQNIPIIWIRQEFESLAEAPLYNRKHNIEAGLREAGGTELLPALHAHDTDYHLIKKRYSSFFNTELETLLQKLAADTLIITGINTMSCIHATAIAAYMRDYEVILATDCIDAYDQKQHEASLEYLQQAAAEAKTNEEILATRA